MVVVLEFDPEVRLAVLKSFDRNEESLRQDIESIKEWFRKQPHLPEVPADRIIERYLVMTKFRMETAKAKLDNYYSVRPLVPEFFFADPNGSEIQKAMDVTYFFPLLKLTKTNNRIQLMRLRDTNPDNFDLTTYTALTYFVYEIVLLEDYTFGTFQVFDLEGVKLAHLAHLTPGFMRKADYVFKRIMVSRLNGLHFINTPPYIDTLLNFIKGLFSKKQADKIFVHRDASILHKLADKDVLPKEYGGTGISLEETNENWRKKFKEYDSLFKHLREVRVNEDLRPEKLLDHELYGVQGNFRKLDID